MIKTKLLLATMLTTNLFSASCWNIKDDENNDFKEMESSMVFSFKDAVNCKPISNANISFFGQNFTTNRDGEFEIPTPPDDLDMTTSLKAKRDGYMNLKQNITASIGTFSTVRFLMTQHVPLTQARIILSWGEKPRDLDLHIKSEDFHISYRNKSGSQYKVSLDKDSMNGFGPETITIKQLEENKKYDIYVSRYSSSGKINNSVNLSVYANGELDKSLQFPNNIKSKCIKVATIYNSKVKYGIEEVSNSHCR